MALWGCGAEGATEEAPDLSERAAPRVMARTGPPPDHVVVEDRIEGEGEEVEPGDVLTVRYVGAHYDGAPYTTSWEEPKLFKLRLGAGSPLITPGWEVGLPGMRVGGRRELVIPPALQYEGPAPRDADTLIYVIDLYGAHHKSSHAG